MCAMRSWGLIDSNTLAHNDEVGAQGSAGGGEKSVWRCCLGTGAFGGKFDIHKI